MALNATQKQAVEYSAGNLLIVAGPGTGKTHTLTHRIKCSVSILNSGQSILAITFTNKAATEMRERLKVLGIHSDCVFVGTFHQLCLQILREYYDLGGLDKDFKIIDYEEISEFLKTFKPELKISERKHFLQRCSQWKSSGLKSPPNSDILEFRNFYRRQGCLDFDDLLWETVHLLQGNADVLDDIHKTYPMICVDEYQDINPVQHRLLQLCLGKEACITAIGDPNQSIYGFRGSQVHFFEQFVEDYPNVKVLTLSENYRSAEHLLSASAQVMAKNNHQFVPELTAQIYLKGCLTIHSAVTDRAEAEYVVYQIERLIGGTSLYSQDSGRVDSSTTSEVSFGDVAVVFRLKSQAVELQKALERSGMPFTISAQKKESAEDQVCPLREEESSFKAEHISLMTMHASKGLEFSVVFIVGCENNIIPLSLPGLSSDINEERRLFYVAMTRAKQRLFLVRSQKRRLYGRPVQNSPSPFLKDIEENLKEYEQSVVKSKPIKKPDTQMTLF